VHVLGEHDVFEVGAIATVAKRVDQTLVDDLLDRHRAVALRPAHEALDVLAVENVLSLAEVVVEDLFTTVS